MSYLPFRSLTVPTVVAGMRLDRFLARWFPDKSRSTLAQSIRLGQVTNDQGLPLKPSTIVRSEQVLRLFIPGIAPRTAPPPFPRIVFEDDDLAVVDKPAGLITHPAGSEFVWSAIGLARERWHNADLVHRIDRETSGLLVFSKNASTNRFLKRLFQTGDVRKTYLALCRGVIPWTFQSLTGRIGPGNGPIRIQMVICPEGLEARTDVDVLETRPGIFPMSMVRCKLFTGRTHQIRVHLADAGYSLIGDRMYGVPPEVFLHAWEYGVDSSVITAAGAPRHALHAASLSFPHPGGGHVDIEEGLPEELLRWWNTPSVLPFDGQTFEAIQLETEEAATLT